MSNYTTQMDAARKGIVTPEIEKVAKKEKMDVDKLMELVASGKVAIPANKHHKSLDTPRFTALMTFCISTSQVT